MFPDFSTFLNFIDWLLLDLQFIIHFISHLNDDEVLLHCLQIHLLKSPVTIERASCSCKVGLGGHCGHVCGVLYQLAHFKMQGIKAIPVDVAKTSLKMTFHQPRTSTITGKTIEEVEVRGHHNKAADFAAKESRYLKSTLYNAVNGPIPLFEELGHSLENSWPRIAAIPALKATTNHEMVTTKFGQAPTGSVLAVQQKLDSNYVINLFDHIEFPALPSKNVMLNENCAVLDQRKTTELDAIVTSVEESREFQDLTVTQSNDALWYRIRKNRITASKIGKIRSRQGNFEKLVTDMKSTRKVTTKPMLRGIECEPLAAACYAELKENGVNLLPCGVVVSPWCPWLGASPDRKVYFPDRAQEPFGLLEIKCPNVKSVLEIKDGSLKRDLNSGQLSLNRNHMHFSQIQMQLAVTGLPWCDYFVWTETDGDFHLETIRFDAVVWQEMKNKVDMFYFDYFL